MKNKTMTGQNKDILSNIDLNNNSISDEGAKYISEALQVNTTLTNICLAANNIDAELQNLIYRQVQR
jgi:hypothetical protein